MIYQFVEWSQLEVSVSLLVFHHLHAAQFEMLRRGVECAQHSELRSPESNLG